MKRIWYVLHVKPRTEKKAAEYLKRYRIWHHLPLLRKVTRVQRRKVVRELPLFPGYVFVKMNPVERLDMLKTNLIVRTIEVALPRQMIHELRQIAHAQRAAKEIHKVEKFTVGEYEKLSKIRGKAAYGTVKALCALGLAKECGKRGRAKLYQRLYAAD